MRLFNETLFLECAQGGSGNIDFEFLAINYESLFLHIGMKNLASFALRERYVMAIHFAFATNFADCHYFVSFTVLTRAVNACGWLTASSANILRSIVVPLCLRPDISWE